VKGDRIIQFSTLHDIHEHIAHARQKHTWPEDMSDAEKYQKAECELHELAAAMFKGDLRGKRKEALDLIAVLIRIVEGE